MMTHRTHRRDWEQTAQAVLLVCCLVVQSLFAGLAAASDAGQSGISAGEFALSLCASQPDTALQNPASMPGHSDDHCLKHCLAQSGAAVLGPVPAVVLPANIVMAEVAAPRHASDALRQAPRDGLGARAPPSILL